MNNIFGNGKLNSPGSVGERMVAAASMAHGGLVAGGEELAARPLGLVNNFINYINVFNNGEDRYRDEENRKIITEKLIKLMKDVPKPSTLQEYFYLVSEIPKGEGVCDMEFVFKTLGSMDVNYKNDYDDTALHEICKLSNEHNDTVKLAGLLIDNNADKHLVNHYGQTVLHIASANDNVGLINFFLLKSSTDAATPDSANDSDNHDEQPSLVESLTFKENQTPLHYAAKNGNVRAVYSLVKDYHAHIEAKDHQNRTPLYLAAEFGYYNVVRELIRLGADIDVVNKYGQTAMYWICAKCAEIAPEVLETFKIQNGQKGVYSLRNLDIVVLKDENGRKEIPHTKSILMNIVECERLDLIKHPVIECLIVTKWQNFGRTRSYLEFFFSLLSLIVWNLLGVLVPNDTRHIYTFPKDWWRIFLFILGILSVLTSIILELIELKNISATSKKGCKQRMEELNEDDSVCHPGDKAQKAYIMRERELCNSENAIKLYFKDKWNWYDALLILLLVAVIGTHIADIAYHDDRIASAHLRIFSVAVIVLGLKLLETGQVMNDRIGILAVTLKLVFKKIIVWFILYFIFWISFTSSFWMLFGYEKFADNGYSYVSNNVNCTRNPAANCTDGRLVPNRTLVEIPYLNSYDKSLFYFWISTFGRGLAAQDMISIDPIMSYILIGLFIGIFALVLVNIFIAMLSSTFDRVSSSAKAYFLLERATRIIITENQLPKSRRIQHLEKLRTDYQKVKSSSLMKESDFNMASFNNIRLQIGDLNDKIRNIKEKLNMDMKKMTEREKKEEKKEEKLDEKREKVAAKKTLDEEVQNRNRINKLNDDMVQFKNFILSKLNPKTSF